MAVFKIRKKNSKNSRSPLRRPTIVEAMLVAAEYQSSSPK